MLQPLTIIIPVICILGVALYLIFGIDNSPEKMHELLEKMNEIKASRRKKIIILVVSLLLILGVLSYKPVDRPKGGSFVAVGRHEVSTSVLIDPAVKKLFETSGGLGGDEDCKKYEEEIAKLNTSQRDELVKILSQVFDPDRAGPPPVTNASYCALGIAADLNPLDARLVGPLLTQVAKGNFNGGEAARLLKQAKELPANIVKAELDKLQMSSAINFIDVLEQVPVDSFELFAEQISVSSGVQEIGYLIILSHSPRSYPQAVDRIRKILASPKGEEQRSAALIAAPNLLPPSEALSWLEPLARLPDGALTLNKAITVAKDKSAFSHLVQVMLEAWDPFDLIGNNKRVDTLTQFGRGLTESLPLLARKMVLIPPNTAEWEKKRHAAAERCYRSISGTGAQLERTCWPDVTPPLSNNCDGRLTEISGRLKKIIQSLDTSDPMLLDKLKDLLNSSEPAIREFAVHILARMDDESSRKLLMSIEKDNSLWVAAIAFSAERLRSDLDSGWSDRTKAFLNEARREGCFTSSTAFLQSLPGLGLLGAEALLSETENGVLPVVAARSLEEVERLPVEFELRLLSLLARNEVQRCDNEQLIPSLVTALMKIDPPSDRSMQYVQRVLNGDELRCCQEVTRLRTGLYALARVAVEKPAALSMLKANFTLTKRLPGGESEVNRAILAASPNEGRRVMYELSSLTKSENGLQGNISMIRDSSRLCLDADGKVFNIMEFADNLGPNPSSKDIAAHLTKFAAMINSRIDSSKGISSSNSEFERLIGVELTELIESLEKDGAHLVSLRNQSCENIVHIAVREGKTDHLRAILRYSPELNLRDRSGRTALMLAAEKNDLVDATLLLDAGAAIDLLFYGHESSISETALTLAAKHQANDVVKLLLSRGASESVGNPRVSLEKSLLASKDPVLIEIINRRKQGCSNI